MEPRQHPTNSLNSRFFQLPEIPHYTPSTPTFSSRVLTSPVIFDSSAPPSAHSPAKSNGLNETEIKLTDEISMAELNGFALACLEKLSLTQKDTPAEETIHQTITQELPAYTTLKADFLSTLHEQRTHHVWTKQMVEAVEPLLKSKSAPQSPQQHLSDLALQCVEQNMLLQDRAAQMRRRLEFIQEAVTQHLCQVGKEIGLPKSLMNSIAKLTRTLLQQYGQ